MTDTNLEALETVRDALEVSLSLWRDDVEPGDFDRDVIEPTQRALAALSHIEARLGEETPQRLRLQADLDNEHDTTRMLIARLAQAEEALRELSTWSLPRWEPDDPQTEGEQMRIFARNYFTEEGS